MFYATYAMQVSFLYAILLQLQHICIRIFCIGSCYCCLWIWLFCFTSVFTLIADCMHAVQSFHWFFFSCRRRRRGRYRRCCCCYFVSVCIFIDVLRHFKHQWVRPTFILQLNELIMPRMVCNETGRHIKYANEFNLLLFLNGVNRHTNKKNYNGHTMAKWTNY